MQAGFPLQNRISACILRIANNKEAYALPSLFKNYFYGKSGKPDFTQEDLPANRLLLFRDVLSVRRGSMMGLNLMYLLCWLPAIFWTFLNLMQLYQLEADPAALGAAVNNIFYSWLLLLMPLIALTGPFNMGVSRVLRNWARDEHSFLLSDFAEALKSNWKQGLVFGCIHGAVPFVCYLCGDFYAAMAKQSPLFYLPLAIILAMGALWQLIAMILPTMIVTYRQSFSGLLKNAALMTLAALPKAILIHLTTLAAPLLIVALWMVFPAALGWATAAFAAAYAIILIAFNKLICASWANALCEKYLNPKIEGARTNIGLRPKHENEETK